MTILNKTLAATAATFITLGGAAFADGHAEEFDVNEARLDISLDTNGDGEVSDDEIIDGYIELFDTDGNGTLDAAERGEAEIMIAAEQ